MRLYGTNGTAAKVQSIINPCKRRLHFFRVPIYRIISCTKAESLRHEAPQEREFQGILKGYLRDVCIIKCTLRMAGDKAK
ncbi:hypothetical protein Barb4_05273 [Bacteroidales bacterium Barb4]|nr:hypothetical protein Barb4_05273 [Bacteroidales bacterium Barb4]